MFRIQNEILNEEFKGVLMPSVIDISVPYQAGMCVYLDCILLYIYTHKRSHTYKLIIYYNYILR